MESLVCFIHRIHKLYLPDAKQFKMALWQPAFLPPVIFYPYHQMLFTVFSDYQVYQ
jgi:hypothetical protein